MVYKIARLQAISAIAIKCIYIMYLPLCIVVFTAIPVRDSNWPTQYGFTGTDTVSLFVI